MTYEVSGCASVGQRDAIHFCKEYWHRTASELAALVADTLAHAARPLGCALLERIVVDHPIAQARLSVMSDERSSKAEYRAALTELATLLVYEATRTLPTNEVQITTPVGPTTGTALANPPLLVPVLRAGLGMAPAAFNLLPESRMGFVGLAQPKFLNLP